MAADGSRYDLGKIPQPGRHLVHIDAGKTTTTEHFALLRSAKPQTGRRGRGDHGNRFSRSRRSRNAASPFTAPAFPFALAGLHHQPDRHARPRRFHGRGRPLSLRVLDGCVVVFDAQKGVEAQSETVCAEADKYQVPRLVFINKMDVVGANFENAVEEVRERLEGNPIPADHSHRGRLHQGRPRPSFVGVIDLLAMQGRFTSTQPTLARRYRRDSIPRLPARPALAWREHNVRCRRAAPVTRGLHHQRLPGGGPPRRRSGR